MSLLVVYNICGLGNRENVDYYIQSIRSILRQDLLDKDVIVSACCNLQSTLDRLFNVFGHTISYINTPNRLTVNMTFNHAVRKCVDIFGKYDGYMYVASDVDMGNDTGALTRLHNLLKTRKYGMIAAQVDNDPGYKWWFGFDALPNDNDFIVPVGKTCNLHAQVFAHEIYKALDRRILFDAFASYCSESCFSFVNAAIKRRFIISGKTKFHHECTMDGSCAGFDKKWDLIFAGHRQINDIISDPAAYACGFGYEEWRQSEGHAGYLMHDPNMFDINGYAKSPYLIEFIKNNLMLSKNMMDYDKIDHIFIPRV